MALEVTAEVARADAAAQQEARRTHRRGGDQDRTARTQGPPPGLDAGRPTTLQEYPLHPFIREHLGATRRRVRDVAELHALLRPVGAAKVAAGAAPTARRVAQGRRA